MKVKILVYGENEYGKDTLNSRMVDVRINDMKKEFERNDVSTEIIVTDSAIQEAEKENKAIIFIEHIEEHLKVLFEVKEDAKVICKICNKTIDEIYEEHKETFQ